MGFDADNLGQSSLMGPLPQHQSHSLTHSLIDLAKPAAPYILLSEFWGGPDHGPGHKIVRTGPLRYVFDKCDLINLIICA